MEAEESYKNALELQPKNVNVLHFLATVQEKIGTPEKLKESLMNFIQYFAIFS